MINGHKTSVGLEDDFWFAVREIASNRGIGVNQLISLIEKEHQQGINISSAIRLFVLDHYRHLAEAKAKQ